MVIKIFVLAKNDRVIDGHSLEQHAVSIFNGRRRHHDQAWIMRIDRLHTLAMKRTAAGRTTRRQAYGNRTRHPRPPMERRSLVDNLVESDCRKIRELHFNDWPHS